MSFEETLNCLDEEGLIVEYTKVNSSFLYLSYNSKDVNLDTLFICKGEKFKKEYLEEAISKGASLYVSEIKYDVDIPYIIVSDIRKAMALISNSFYSVGKREGKLFVVTGTSGKTTTVNYIKDILNYYTGKKNIYLSTVSSYDGYKNIKYKNTTPEIIDIDRCIKNLKTLDIPYMVLEVSSQAEKLKRIYNLKFDIGVLTNINIDHISKTEHKDFKEYLDCKINILKKCRKVIINKDVMCYDEIVNSLSNKEIITYGYSNCNYNIKNVFYDKNSTTFDLVHNGNVNRYSINMPGEFNMFNAVNAIILANEIGIKYSYISSAIKNTSVLGRMNIINNFRCPIIVDYAHNKESLDALINVVKQNYGNRDIKLVFGCTGDRAINRIDDLGDLAGKFASKVYLTADDPGPREVLDICFDIAKNFKKYGTSYTIIIDRSKAIEQALDEASSHDIVLIIGKGDETYQKVKDEVLFYEGDISVVNNYVNLLK